MAEEITQTSPCESCRIYQQEICLLRDKILALETEKGLNDTLPMEPGKETGKSDTCNKKLNDTVTFPKLNRQLGARPKQSQHAVKNAPGIRLTNRYSPLKTEYNEQKQPERNRDHEVKTKEKRKTVQSVKARDTMVLGDGAISNINMDRMITCSYPSATVSDITDVLNKEIGNNPGINQIVVHVGAVDIRNERSEKLKEAFNKLFERLDCHKETIQVFISGPIPNIDGRINKFSRLFQLNSWLSKVCESRGLYFIENFNLFWKRDDLFKGNGPHLSRGGVRRLTDNFLHALQNQRRPELQERDERSKRRAPVSPAKDSPASPTKDSVASVSSATVNDSATVKDPATGTPSTPTVKASAADKDTTTPAAPPAPTVMVSPAAKDITTPAVPPVPTVMVSPAAKDITTPAVPPAPTVMVSPAAKDITTTAPPASTENDSAAASLSSTPPQAWNSSAISTPSRDSSESFPSPESPMMGFPRHFENLVKQGTKMTPLTPVMSRFSSPKKYRAPLPPFSLTKASPARPPPPVPTAAISSSFTAAV